MLGRIRYHIDKLAIKREPLLNGLYEKVIKRSNGALLCLHEVDDIDPNKLWVNESLKVSPAYLEKLIVNYLNNDIDIISLDQASQRILEGSKKRFVCFTFDDGYKDNYLNAYPIFKKYNVPFCINIASSFPEKSAILFWYILEDLLLENDSVTLNDGTTYKCDTKELKEEAFVAIREKIFKIPVSEYGSSIKELLYKYQFDLYKPVVEHSLDWSEIQEMKESGLCTFGNHTHSHISIFDADAPDIVKDISMCNDLYKKNIGEELKYFCYPYGRYDEGRQQLIEDNFSFTGLLTLKQEYVTNNTKLNSLPRFLIEEKKNGNC